MMQSMKKVLMGVVISLFLTGVIAPLQVFAGGKQVTIHINATVVKKSVEGGRVTFTGGWDPRKITVQQGDRVTLVITALDSDHDFALPQYNIEQYVPSGQTVTIQFTANQAGIFPFRCGDAARCGATHRSMVGELIVDAATGRQGRKSRKEETR